MNAWPEIVAAETTHARLGNARRAFRYRVDYVLIDPAARKGPLLFSRNRANLVSVHDCTHGGPRGAGTGADWARQVLAEAGAPVGLDLRLLTQPRFLGFWFAPVSFWLAFRQEMLIAVIAEVSNTFGERHSYLCARDNFQPILPSHRLTARKIFYVSPFQDVEGDYTFVFDISANRVAIRIALRNGDEGLIATLSGRRVPLSNRALLASLMRLPFGPLRTLALIYWNALVLKHRGVRYRARPNPPKHEVSR